MTPTDTFPEARFGVVVEHPGIRGLVYLVLSPDRFGARALVVRTRDRDTGTVRTISWSASDNWIILDEGIE